MVELAPNQRKAIRPRLRPACFAFVMFLAGAGVSFGGDYLFVNAPYLRLTRQVVQEADLKAPLVFGSTSPVLEKFQSVRSALLENISTVETERRLKKVTDQSLVDLKDKSFADALNSFKDAINFMSKQSSKPLPDLLPSYQEWTELETAVVKAGLDQRLAAYETRFGSDSEPINALELFLGEKFLPGDESGPSPWEPILRFTAIQITNHGSGLTSGMQVGTNYYFVKNPSPKYLKAIGISNHVGLAAMVQYPENPGVFNFRGRPSFGAQFHFDRKEAGLSWDTQNRKLRITLGYSFQFVPFVF